MNLRETCEFAGETLFITAGGLTGVLASMVITHDTSTSNIVGGGVGILLVATRNNITDLLIRINKKRGNHGEKC